MHARARSCACVRACAREQNTCASEHVFATLVLEVEDCKSIDADDIKLLCMQ